MNASTAILTPARQAAFERTWAVPAAVAAGVLLGFAYTLSPLTVWYALASGAIVWAAGRNLPTREQKWVRGVLIVGLAVRALMVAWLFVFGTSDHMWFNTFFGDEQYLVVRSLRLRKLWLGEPLSLEALIDVFELYGRTSYLKVIAFVQLLVGPAPYGIHLLNAALFSGGAVVLHRIVRSAYGRVPALATLTGVLFYPSLLFWSASALKESLNFLVVTCTMAAVIAMVRATWRWRLLAALGVVAGLAALSTLRAGAFEMAAAGLTIGLIGRVLTRRLWRLAVAIVVLAAIALPTVRSPRVQSLTLRVLRPAAAIHMGHVFTRGHAYKLLDQRLYVSQIYAATITWDEATRFVRRGIVSVVLLPRPWDSQSVAELAYVPEQLAWYAILVTAAIGLAAGFRRDALVTALFASYALFALIVVGLNTGNIGTLVRHRAFALPYLIALSANGAAAMLGRFKCAS